MQTIQALQVRAPGKAADVPVAASGIVMHHEYARTIGRLNAVLPCAPRGHVGMLNDYIDPGQTFIACPNQDVVYGLGFFALDEGR